MPDYIALINMGYIHIYDDGRGNLDSSTQEAIRFLQQREVSRVYFFSTENYTSQLQEKVQQAKLFFENSQLPIQETVILHEDVMHNRTLGETFALAQASSLTGSHTKASSRRERELLDYFIQKQDEADFFVSLPQIQISFNCNAQTRQHVHYNTQLYQRYDAAYSALEQNIAANMHNLKLRQALSTLQNEIDSRNCAATLRENVQDLEDTNALFDTNRPADERLQLCLRYNQMAQVRRGHGENRVSAIVLAMLSIASILIGILTLEMGIGGYFIAGGFFLGLLSFGVFSPPSGVAKATTALAAEMTQELNNIIQKEKDEADAQECAFLKPR